MTDSLAPLPALLERAAEMLCDIADGRKEIPTQAMYDLRVDLLVAASTRGSRRLSSPEGSDTKPEPDREYEDGIGEMYGGAGLDDLERELSQRRNAVGEGTLASMMTNAEFYMLLRTARYLMDMAVRLERERDDARDGLAYRSGGEDA